jgi:DNA repair exonuclease SbcCD ATPase subunit
MISIRHEGSGPYVDRTVIEWNGTRYVGDVPDADSLEELLVEDFTREDREDLEGERDRALKEVDEQQDRIDELEAELAEAEKLLDKEDPGATIRDRLDDWRKQALRTARENKALREEVERLRVEVKQGRARTCVVCSRWSKHDDRGYCVHGKPIKGLALKRKTAA